MLNIRSAGFVPQSSNAFNPAALQQPSISHQSKIIFLLKSNQ
jgi:hypothetical protein